MMNHMDSHLTRFNLHIRVKGRRNVQGPEQIRYFELVDLRTSKESACIGRCIPVATGIGRCRLALLKVGFCRIDKLNRILYRTVLHWRSALLVCSDQGACTIDWSWSALAAPPL